MTNDSEESTAAGSGEVSAESAEDSPHSTGHAADSPESTGEDELGQSGATSNSGPSSAVEIPEEEAHEWSTQEEVVLAELLDELPEDSRLREHVIELIEMYSGPLPDAKMLEAYKSVDPKIVDEVLEEAKANRVHRINMDRWLVMSARMSLALTTVVILATIAAVVILGVADQPVLAGVFGAGGLAAIVAVMIKGGGRWDGRGEIG